jgi:hypothetical protein
MLSFAVAMSGLVIVIMLSKICTRLELLDIELQSIRRVLERK